MRQVRDTGCARRVGQAEGPCHTWRIRDCACQSRKHCTGSFTSDLQPRPAEEEESVLMFQSVLYVGAVKCSTLSVPGCVAGAAIFFSLSLHLCVCVCLRNALSKPIEPLNRIGLLSLPQRPQEPLDGLQWPRRRRTHSQNYWKKQPSALNTDVLSKDASIFLPSDSKRCHGYLSLESNYMLDIFYTIPGHFLLFLVLHVFLDISSYFF